MPQECREAVSHLARTIHGIATPVDPLTPEAIAERTGAVKREDPVWSRLARAFPPSLPNFWHAQYRPVASMKSESSELSVALAR